MSVEAKCLVGVGIIVATEYGLADLFDNLLIFIIGFDNVNRYHGSSFFAIHAPLLFILRIVGLW